MNDKQQLAAMGAQYRLTEEQAKGLAERMPQTGALQVIDDEPLCMAKRIEELEAQVRVMAELLRDLHEYIGTSIPLTISEHYLGCDLLERIDAALPSTFAPEGWQLVPVEPTPMMLFCGGEHIVGSNELPIECWYDMLAVAPSPDCAK